MRLYSIGAVLKIMIGLGILRVLYHYVNVYEDPVIGISFGFLGIFMMVRGATYYLFLFGYRLFSTRPQHVQSSLSYKLSLLLGLYVMINITLMITDKRSKLLALLLVGLFIILQIAITYERTRYQ